MFKVAADPGNGVDTEANRTLRAVDVHAFVRKSLLNLNGRFALRNDDGLVGDIPTSIRRASLIQHMTTQLALLANTLSLLCHII